MHRRSFMIVPPETLSVEAQRSLIAMAARRALLSCPTSNQALSSQTIQFFAEWRSTTEISKAHFELRPGWFPASSCREHKVSLSNCQRTLPLLGRGGDWRRTGGTGRSKELWKFVPKASVAEEQQQQPNQASVETSPPTLKFFLEDLKPLGRVRLIVNTGVAVLESVTSFEKLFYHACPRGEYANIMSRDDNVDFHLLLARVALVRLVKGKSPKDIPTYMVRVVDRNDSVAVSILVMWRPGTDGEYDPGQVDAFLSLLEKYGEEYKFPAAPAS